MAVALGIGNALLDVLARVPDTVLETLKLPKGSMQLIDAETNDAVLKTIAAYPLSYVSGGSASNCIATLAHLGVKCALQGKIGHDETGARFKADLEKSGIEANMTLTTLNSGCANTLVTPDGQRTFGTFLGAAATLDVDDIKAELMQGKRLLHTEGYLVQNIAMFRKMLETAKTCGLKVSLDVGSFNVVNENKAFFLEMIEKYVDILFCNEEESEALTGLKDPEAALLALEKIVELPIVKVGSQGSLIRSQGKTLRVGITKVEKVVDTTGAGDSYAGTFLAGWIRGVDLQKAGEAAAYVSAQVIQKLGARLEEEQWVEVSKKVEEIFQSK